VTGEVRGASAGEGVKTTKVSLEGVLDQLGTAGWKGFSMLRRYRSENPTPARILARQLRSVPFSARPDFESRRVRFAFVSSASMGNVEDALMLESLGRGIIAEQYHSASRQTSRELRDPGSGLYTSQPDVIVVAVAPAALSGDADPRIAIGKSDAAAFLDSLVEDLRALRARSDALLLVHNFMAPELRTLGLQDWREREGTAAVYARLNLDLAERCREIPDTQVVDAAHLTALSGAGWWTLHRGFFLARVGIPEPLAPFLAREYAAFGAARRGFLKKCLVLDLDDTLWGGVVGEAGADKVEVGTEYPGSIFQAIQQAVVQLHERGVVLALNSQNNEEDGWAPFERREMRLERRHIAASRINWKDKVTNLQELAAELRLGLDSFVMLDNDPVQRAWVEDSLPEVHVIAAQDPLEMLYALVTERLFESLGRTAEDGLRAKSYEAASLRREEETSAADREAFLHGLGLVVTVGRATPETLPRLAQMAQRTNQFNLTTKRYTEGQIRELCASPDAKVLYCSCRDRFADEGIIGMAILMRRDAEWVVDTFLLSCRVLSWGVERALAAALYRAAAGAVALRGEYVKTAKNGISAGLYRDLGFERVRSDDDGATWRLPLPASSDPAPPWIRLQIEGEPL
jgi:FkbH-like protein